MGGIPHFFSSVQAAASAGGVTRGTVAIFGVQACVVAAAALGALLCGRWELKHDLTGLWAAVATCLGRDRFMYYRLG